MFFKRNTRGEFTRKHKPLSTLQKRILLGFVFVCFSTIFGGQIAEREGLFDNTLHVVNFADAAEIIVTSESASTVEEMKADVLDRLAKCENPNQKPIVFDTNGIASVGQYRWQPHSFQYYWQKMTGEKLTEKDAVMYALDDVKARELAAFVIF